METKRHLWCVLLALGGLAYLASTACAREEVTDLKVAQADPDFAVQGEYLGEGTLPDGSQGKLGAQVIARGNGKFEVFFLKGGLPGEGWKKGDARVRGEAERQGDAIVVKGPDLEGKIAQGKMTLGGKAKIELARVERKSPTLGAKPPAGAVILFDGSSVDQFDHGTLSAEGNLFPGVTTKQGFNDYHLHLEFRLSWMPEASGQGRSNSGVYVHDCYEIQVLDSFGLEGRNNECGGFYSIKEPDVNMCLPPMVWQTYDIDFTAPKFAADGKKLSNARITVCQNGVPIHDNVELDHATPGRQGEGPGPRPLHLQGHGCKVQYRNIWLEKKD